MMQHCRTNRFLAAVGTGLAGLWWLMSFVSAAEPPRVVLFDADGREHQGALTSLSHESVGLSDSVGVRSWSDVVRLRFERAEVLAAEPRGSAIWLANGDRLIARGVSIDDEHLHATWREFPDWPELVLPLEAVRGLSLSLPSARERRDEVAAWLLDRKSPRDELRLVNGDVLGGEVLGWRVETVTLKSSAGELKLPSAEIRDIGFNPELLALPEPKELCWLTSLRDGSRVTLLASRSRMVAGTLRAAHVTGLLWDIPLESIAEMRVLRGRAVYLSDLSPVEAKHTPFLPGARAWPLRRDRAVTGRPLRLGGREYPKGLGAHSRSTATFDLAGKYRAFQAIVGLDDTTTGEGTAVCTVEVDGRRVFEEPALSRQKGPIRLPLIDLTESKWLTLTVDFGELGDSQDHVNWGDAVLLRADRNEK